MSKKLILHPHSIEVVEPDYIQLIKNDFELQGFSRLTSFLSPALTKIIEQKLPESKYKKYLYRTFGEEETAYGAVFTILNLALNQPKVIEVMQPLVDDQFRLNFFNGRHYIYRNQKSHLVWHQDRRAGHLGLTINIMPEFYLGGNLEFKHSKQKSDEPRIIASNKFFGDAIIFPTHSNQLHRVIPVKEGCEKIAFAGWFATKEKGGVIDEI